MFEEHKDEEVMDILSETLEDMLFAHYSAERNGLHLTGWKCIGDNLPTFQYKTLEVIWQNVILLNK